MFGFNNIAKRTSRIHLSHPENGHAESLNKTGAKSTWHPPARPRPPLLALSRFRHPAYKHPESYAKNNGATKLPRRPRQRKVPQRSRCGRCTRSSVAEWHEARTESRLANRRIAAGGTAEAMIGEAEEVSSDRVVCCLCPHNCLMCICAFYLLGWLYKLSGIVDYIESM